MSEYYVKPSINDIRQTANAFGSLPASKMMKIRERTTKMVLMDYATHLIDVKQMSFDEVTSSVEKVVNNAIEKGLCTKSIIKPIIRLINKKFLKEDPALKLHFATTMEVLEELGGSGNTDVSVLPEEIQNASECGPECFGHTAPSMESLTTSVLNDPRKKIIGMVGGTLSTQIIQTLSDSLEDDYIKSR